MGIFGAEQLCAEFHKDLDDYNVIMTKALADRLAEAFAECIHEDMRKVKNKIPLKKKTLFEYTFMNFLYNELRYMF